LETQTGNEVADKFAAAIYHHPTANRYVRTWRVVRYTWKSETWPWNWERSQIDTEEHRQLQGCQGVVRR
jgi:hypothetical protein